MIMKKFQKRIEDFTCINCKKEIKGTGYTDHCPHCLYSTHVDINPGYRMAECKGIMVPTGVEKEKERYIIYYQCLKCEHTKRVKMAEDDNLEKIILLSANTIKNDSKTKTKKKNRRTS